MVEVSGTPPESIDEFFGDNYLINPPVKRAAYSDRMALIMAWMSKLAYTKFENPEAADRARNDHLNEIVARIIREQTAEGKREVLNELLNRPPDRKDHHSKKGLEAELARVNFRLVDAYDHDDTQAFLAQRPPNPNSPSEKDGVLVLSFRGTESTNIKDWKTNATAKTKKIENDILVHTGFWNAFDGIRKMIEPDVKKFLDEGYTFYITGHSLGGALAMIATHEIGRDSQGACYTFGAPRVASYGFGNIIKTPIYRLVNANDLVPRLPPAHLPQFLQFILALLPFPGTDTLNRLLDRFTKYVHHGDMRYFRRANRLPGGGFDKIQLLSNPNMIHRFRWFIIGFIRNRKSPIEDHSILTYCEKLRQYALKRR